MLKHPLLAVLVLSLSACAAAPLAGTPARELSSDELAWTRQGGIEAAVVDGRLAVVRADLRRARLVLLNPPETDNLRVAQLAEREKLAVATNAAMFAADYVTSIGYMKNFGRVNNARVSPKLQGWLFFNPKEPSAPAAKVGTKADLSAYHSAFQTHRMIDDKGTILWKKGASIYRQVGLVGVDAEARVLFFQHPPLIDVHDLVARILSLNLGLKGLLYLDGGSHGALFLDRALGRSSNAFIGLPNVLGLRAEGAN